MSDERFPPRDRAAEKEAQRARDRERLFRGEVTPAELQDENNFFRGLGPFRIVAISRRRLRTPF